MYLVSCVVADLTDVDRILTPEAGRVTGWLGLRWKQAKFSGIYCIMGVGMIETERLILDQWCEADLLPFAQLNGDLKVMRYFPATLSEAESNSLAWRIRDLIEEQGYGFWALRLKDSGEFIGFTGLHHQHEGSGIPHVPLVEIGWRLSAEHWGRGYAPEAARAALAFAFNELELEEVYAFTALPNLASRQVMEKIGMRDTGEDFDHPKLPQGHWLERHCLYRIVMEGWQY